MQTFSDEINKYRQEFYPAYSKEVESFLEVYENKRKETLKKVIKRVVISSIIVLMALIPTIFLSVRIWNLWINAENMGWEILGVIVTAIIFIISLIVTINIPIMEADSFTEKLKKILYKKLIKVFDDLHWYSSKDVIPNSDLIESGLFAGFNKRELFDSFSGNYKGVPFLISETILTCEARNYYKVCFEGVVIKINANKNIQTKITISRKKDNNINNSMPFPPIIFAIPLAPFCWFLSQFISNGFNLFDLLIAIFIFLYLLIFILGLKIFLTFCLEKKAVTQKVNLEDVSFTRDYNVQTNDQVEARYLVTPAFMERFKNIETVYGATNIKCSFYGDTLMFAISTPNNVFELGGLFTSLNNSKKIETFFEELIAIYLLIDYFKLDENTGL